MKANVAKCGAVALALATAMAAPVSVAAPTGVQDTSPITALRLNGGTRWPTDAPLRKAMSEIRDALSAEKDGLRAGAMNAARYESLATAIDAQTAAIIVNCRLPPDADAQLHIVLTQIMQGSAAMKGYDPNLARRAGAEKVVAALDAYSRYFDHPGWKDVFSG